MVCACNTEATLIVALDHIYVSISSSAWTCATDSLLLALDAPTVPAIGILPCAPPLRSSYVVTFLGAMMVKE